MTFVPAGSAGEEYVELTLGFENWTYPIPRKGERMLPPKSLESSEKYGYEWIVEDVIWDMTDSEITETEEDGIVQIHITAFQRKES